MKTFNFCGQKQREWKNNLTTSLYALNCFFMFSTCRSRLCTNREREKRGNLNEFSIFCFVHKKYLQKLKKRNMVEILWCVETRSESLSLTWKIFMWLDHAMLCCWLWIDIIRIFLCFSQWKYEKKIIIKS